jgi:SNF2 family DNA or RNA helicase
MSGIEPHVALRLKSVFPKIDKTQTGVFAFKDSEATCADLEWFTQRYEMSMSAVDRIQLTHGRETFDRKRDEIETILLPEWKPAASAYFKPDKNLYQFQAQAVELVRKLGRLLLMDDLGLGKTVSALGVINGSQHLPAAVVVQAHLPTQWLHEFIEPFTYMKAHIIDGTTPYSLPAANIYLFRYSNIAGWTDIAATGMFRAVIFDEIQELRRGTITAKGRAAKVFSEHAQIRMGLSATPVVNYGDEIFHIMEYIAPGCLGTWPDFAREWCRFNGRKWIVNDPDALGTYLREIQVVLRREGSTEPVNVIPIEVDYDEEIEQEEEELTRVLAMKVLTGSFTERGQAARELDIQARRITGLAKARHVAAYVRILLESGTPVLLSGWHRDVFSVWLEELKEFNPVLYTGTESSKQKDAAKQAFISGKTDLMIISLRSGAGLDGLQKRCSTVVLGELDWSSAIHSQLIGRLNRPGQKEKVTAIYLHANGGSDPLVLNIIGLKAGQARGIVNPLQGVQTVHTDESRIKLLAERFLQKFDEKRRAA